MIYKASLFLGIRTLFGRGIGSRTAGMLIGAIFGVGFSIIPLIVVILLANGMIEGITRRYLEVGSYHIQAKNFYSPEKKELEQISQMIMQQQFVDIAFPVVTGMGLVYSPGGRTGVTIRCLPADYWEQDQGAREYLAFSSGKYDLSHNDATLISEEVARILNVSVGDRIRLLTARQREGRTPLLRPTHLTVTGIFSTGYYELDSHALYLPFNTGMTLFNEPGSAFIGIKVVEPYDNIDKNVAQLKSVLPKVWHFYSWYNLEQPMYRTLETTKNLLLFIMVLIVAVATVNISSAMLMLVMEKESEIAILKSTGADKDTITVSFVFVGLFIGLLGVIIGISLGLCIAVNINSIIEIIEYIMNNLLYIMQQGISMFSDERKLDQIVLFDTTYYLDKIPIRIAWKEVLATGIVTLLLSIIVTYIPARNAGSVRPLDVLRKH